MMNLQNLTDLYLKNYHRRLSTPLEINCGDCYRYAKIANKLYGGDLWSVTIMVEDQDDYSNKIYTPYGSHAFIKINDLFYDSESPNGINNWEELHYFNYAGACIANSDWYYEVRKHPNVKSFNRFWKPRKNLLKADARLIKKILEIKNEN